MQFFTAIMALTASLTGTIPATFAKPSEQMFKRDEVHCGTTSDATLSDCQTLINNRENWNAAFSGEDNVCHYTLNWNFQAYNTACRGDCCVYYASGKARSEEGPLPSAETIRSRAADLLGCGNTDANKINGLGVSDSGSGVCISNDDGCGDCFDDSDFS